jgi:hypothetical protein
VRTQFRAGTKSVISVAIRLRLNDLDIKLGILKFLKTNKQANKQNLQ